jgi:hypothetical protein
LMVFNVVYTLFFATTIVCLARGMLWWGKWLLARRENRKRHETFTALEAAIARA